WALPEWRTWPRVSFIRYTGGRSGRFLRVASRAGVTLEIVGAGQPGAGRYASDPQLVSGNEVRDNWRMSGRCDTAADGSASGGGRTVGAACAGSARGRDDAAGAGPVRRTGWLRQDDDPRGSDRPAGRCPPTPRSDL